MSSNVTPVNNSRKNSLLSIDFMRSICCILVVIIHVTAAFWYVFEQGSLQFKTIIFLNTLSKFAVPAFIFISGFVLYYVYSSRDLHLIDFYKKRMFKVIIPYIIWSTIYILVNYAAVGQPINLKSLTYYFFLGKANYHLYYISLILQFYILFPILLKIYQRFSNPIIPVGLFTLLNFTFISYVKINFSDRIFIYYLMFFILGFLLADFKKKEIKPSLYFLTLITLIYSMVATYYLLDTYKVLINADLISRYLYKHSWWYFSIVSILFLYSISSFSEKKLPALINNSFITSIGKHSFTIYLCHPLIMKILHFLTPYKNLLKTNPSILIILEFIIVLLFSWLLSYLLSELKVRLKASKIN